PDPARLVAAVGDDPVVLGHEAAAERVVALVRAVHGTAQAGRLQLTTAALLKLRGVGAEGALTLPGRAQDAGQPLDVVAVLVGQREGGVRLRERRALVPVVDDLVGRDVDPRLAVVTAEERGVGDGAAVRVDRPAVVDDQRRGDLVRRAGLLQRQRPG